MSSTVSKNSGHTAISSWSGYLYQGKIAIYHALKLLTSNMDISNFTLRLDCEEDFDILNGEEVVSLHQVKGKGSDLFSGYKSAFKDIQGKTKDYPNAKLYFHLATSIRDKTVDSIEVAHSPVKVYTYSEDKYHCTLEETDTLIEDLIKEYLSKNNVDDYRLQGNYIVQLREKLDDLVINKILLIHYKNMKGEGKMYKLAEQNPISLSEFQEILISDNIGDWIDSNDYIGYLAKYTFNKYLYIFLNNRVEEIDKQTENRLKKYIIHISNLSVPQIEKFVKLLIPHKKVNFESLKDYVSNSIQEDEFKYAFYEMLSSITKELNLNNESLFWLNRESIAFSPTAIDKSGDRQKVNTCNDIVKNIVNTDLNVAFECQKLITTELDVDSIFNTANNVNEVLSNDDDAEIDFDENEHKRISRWKKVSLISIENAKKELDND